MGVIGPEAITRLWHEQGSALVLYAQQWCDAPEDVVQEAFLLLVRQLAAPENPVGWLYRVVRNRAMNASRGSGRAARREAAIASRHLPWFEENDAERLDAATATLALQEIPLEDREIVIARVWGGLSFDEIAQVTGVSASTVRRAYQRGLERLRERLRVPCPTRKGRTT